MTDKEQTTTSGHDQPWGTSAHGDAERAVRSEGPGTGVGGASLAGTPAGPGAEPAETEPDHEGDPSAGAPGGSGVFADEAWPPV